MRRRVRTGVIMMTVVVIMACSVVIGGRFKLEHKIGGAAGRVSCSAGVKDMETVAQKSRVAGLLPTIAPLERTFRVDEKIGDVGTFSSFRRPAP